MPDFVVAAWARRRWMHDRSALGNPANNDVQERTHKDPEERNTGDPHKLNFVRKAQWSFPSQR
jgi:hypothetical protein